MSARAKKRNLFSTPKALAARQTTPARGGAAAHAARGAAAGPKAGTTLGTYEGYRIWKDVEGEYRFSGDPDSAFASLRVVKGHIDWLRKGRGNPRMTTIQLRQILRSDRTLDPDLVKRAMGALSGIWSSQHRDVDEWIAKVHSIKPEVRQFVLDVIASHAETRSNPFSDSIVESEIPVFRSGPAGFPGVDYMISYPELNQAIAYAQAVKGAYPHVGVVCLEEAEEKLPGGDYAVVLHAEVVRAVEAGQVGKQQNPALQLTRAMAWAAATDAGNRSMRAAGRTKWNRQDFSAAAAEFDRLWPRHLDRNPAVRSHAHLKGYEDGHAHVGYLPEDTELAKQAGRRGCSSREDKRDYCQGFKAAMMERRRRNPEDSAAEMYESFHGRPADRVVEVTEELHEHEWLADLGGLVSFHIETATGLEADLEFTSDAPKLASNEAGTQLFVVGGKQTINLKPLKMDGPDWRKESMVLGWIWVLTYNTEKDFDKFELIDYYHKLSETERGSIEKRRKTLPSLRYDSVNEKLYIDGGKYRIDKPLVGTSPGIEN